MKKEKEGRSKDPIGLDRGRESGGEARQTRITGSSVRKLASLTHPLPRSPVPGMVQHRFSIARVGTIDFLHRGD